MKGTVIHGALGSHNTDMLIIFTAEDEDSAEYKTVEKLLGDDIKALRESKEFTGKKLQAAMLRTPKQAFKKLLLVGLGKKQEVNLETLRRAAGTAVKVAREFSDHLTVPFHDDKAEGLDQAIQAITEGIVLSNYKFLKYKTQGLDEIKQLKRFTIIVEKTEQQEKAKQGLHRGLILGEAANYARDLVNTPASDLNPATMEKEAKRLAREHDLDLTILNEGKLRSRKMEAMLAVGRGSPVKPRLLVLEYKKRKAKEHLIFCGKGVTYDSGGYNLKTKMLEAMKDDMGGAAALMGMLVAIAKLKLPVHVTVIIGAVENMISGNAYKPGDVVKAMNGKTIEVANTDAEGRIVLADCLSYASTLKNDGIIDIATLTGAAMVALGANAAAVCSPTDGIAEGLVAAGDVSGDRAWRIPMWDDYKEDIKSEIADVKNLGFQFYAGIAAGAIFLQEFVKEPKKWAHIDMGAAVNEERERPCIPKGATGWGVRILTNYVENR
ncbi:leucyl aminopeptidase [Candidatus Woesearchaeota archaeon]|nr:leucyl aminopeptidase [Candidatus Woesearchaeota archaeon]